MLGGGGGGSVTRVPHPRLVPDWDRVGGAPGRAQHGVEACGAGCSFGVLSEAEGLWFDSRGQGVRVTQLLDVGHPVHLKLLYFIAR